MVIPSDFFDPLATLQAIHEERCTAVHGVPTMFIAELGTPASANSISVRCAPASWRARFVPLK